MLSFVRAVPLRYVMMGDKVVELLVVSRVRELSMLWTIALKL